MNKTKGKNNPNYKHGMSKTPEHRAWMKMKDRCYNVNNKRYYTYGERGIIVCDRWLESFSNFYKDVGLRPSNKHSLHRINNDGNYEPGNVKWGTAKEQANERTIAIKVTLNNKTLNLKDWCRELNLHYYTVLFRIHEMNMTPIEALLTPLKKKYRDYYIINGISKCLKDWAKEYNIPYATLRNRVVKKKMDILLALTTPIDAKYSKASYEGKRHKG